MKKIIYLFISIAFILSSCGGGNKNGDRNTRDGKGGIKYGGVFRMNELEDFKSLYPLNVTMTIEHRITNQIFQGLVKLDQKDLKIIPALAEKMGR